MRYELLIQNAKGNLGSLANILNEHQPNLGINILTIGDFTLISGINPESEWDYLITNMQLNGFTPLILVEAKPFGSDIVLYPAPTAEYDDVADAGAQVLHWFRRELADEQRKAKQEEKRVLESKKTYRTRRRAGRK